MQARPGPGVPGVDELARGAGAAIPGTNRDRQGLSWVVVTHALLPNGPAHRLADTLRGRGLNVAFCALPMPGAERWRAESAIEGRGLVTSTTDLPLRVPMSRLATNVASAVGFARRLRRLGITRPVLVGCDPVSYLQGAAALRVVGIRPRVEVVWFVDWSAQRLERYLEGAAYRRAVQLATRRADVVCAISSAAARGIEEVASSRRQLGPVGVLPNLPMSFAGGPPWDLRAPQVVYMGGLRREHGAELLLAVTRILLGEGTASGVDVLGDGPLAGIVARAAERLPGLRFHGLVQRADAIEQILHGARVGLGLYDPSFPMFGFNDSLKTKDYLGAGLVVVTTLPTAVADSQVLVAPFDPEGVADTVRAALSGPPLALGAHPLLREGFDALDRLIAEVDRLTAGAGS